MSVGLSATCSQSRAALCALIAQWNESRYELFRLTPPNETLEFFGVIRFYFHEPGERVTTKCLRVSSVATTREVISALIAKFHPDMRMLSQPTSYAIWEVHESGRERRLDVDEHPLHIQLDWQKDALEGRFQLRRDNLTQFHSPSRLSTASARDSLTRSKRRFSKRGKRDASRKSRDGDEVADVDEDSRSIYAELPPSTFTRTISNPEIVMQKRREQKIENRLKEITYNGGSLKVYGVELFPDRPYVTLLVNANDNAAAIVAGTLDKYGVGGQAAGDYVLVEVSLSAAMFESCNSGRMSSERLLTDDERPLLDVASQPGVSKNVVYLLRHRPTDAPRPSRVDSARRPASLHIAKSVAALATTGDFASNVNGPSTIPNGQLASSMHKLASDTNYVSSPAAPRSFSNYSPAGNHQPTIEIPALLDVPNQACETRLLCEELFGVPPSQFAFRLTPAFVIYMVCRQRLSTLLGPPQMTMDRRLHAVSVFVSNFAALCYDRIHAAADDHETLMLWLANTSELLHMFQGDQQLRACERYGIHSRLTDVVERAYDLFVEYCRVAVRPTLHRLLRLDIADPMSNDDDAAAGDVVALLDEIIRLIRKAFLNSVLTIQLFSQLFHFINMYIFNWLVTTNEGRSYLTHAFGVCLRCRLHSIQKWAERQGLEQTFECHMDRLLQAVDLLTTPKTNDQIASLGASCYRLNSVQVRYLLENYLANPEREKPVSAELIDQIAYLASTQADAIDAPDGGQPPLEESQKLQLPFLLPKDAYLIDVVRGISPELMAYMMGLQERGVSRLILQNTALWTCHMTSAEVPEESGTTDYRNGNMNLNNNIVDNKLFPHHNNNNNIKNNKGFYNNYNADCDIKLCRDCDAVPCLESPPRRRFFRAASQLAAAPALPSLPSLGNLTSVQNWPTAGSAHTDPIDCKPSSSSTIVQSPSDNIEVVTIHRSNHEGIGLSIVAGHLGSEPSGIYVKKVIENSAAHRNGRLATGDQLLSVNRRSLIGITQEEAAGMMASAGTEIRFEVAKNAARRNGLDSWLRVDVSAPPSQPPFQLSQPLQRYQNASTRSRGAAQPLPQPLKILSNPPIMPMAAGSLHNRSLSASELHSQTDSTSIASDFSVRQHLNGLNGQGPNGTLSAYYSQMSGSQGQQYNQAIGGSHYGPLASSQFSYSRLPAHYRSSARQPAGFTQPMPNGLRQQSNDLAGYSDNYSVVSKPIQPGQAGLLQQTSTSLNRAPLADVETASLSSIGIDQSSIAEQQHRRLLASGRLGVNSLPHQICAYTNSSSSTSPLPPPLHYHGTSTASVVKVPPPVAPKSRQALATLSGRRSAPIFGAETEDQNEIRSELNRLQISGLAGASPAERARYEQLVQRLQIGGVKSTSALNHHQNNNFNLNNNQNHNYRMRQTHSASVLGFDHSANTRRHQQPPLPYMSEMADRLESNRIFPALRPKSRTPQPETAHIESAIDNVSAVANRLAQTSIDIETANRISSTTIATAAVIEESEESEKDENTEPRVEIVGANEIYNDPRQRRLNEPTKSLRPVVDGSNLDFRDKMRLFAEQLGEQLPRNRQKISSAEREIEKTATDKNDAKPIASIN